MPGLQDALRDLSGPVRADLFESDDAYVLVIDLPGAVPEATDVTVAGGVIRITTNREQNPPTADVMRAQRPTTISAELPLPPDVDDEGISASLSSGVMEVRLPRGLPGTSIPISEE